MKFEPPHRCSDRLLKDFLIHPHNLSLTERESHSQMKKYHDRLTVPDKNNTHAYNASVAQS